MIIRILIEFNLNMAHISTGLISSLIVFILIMQENDSRTIPEDAFNTNIDFECRTDNDCSEKNNYCDISLNLCSQCMNCSIYFRTTKKNIKCPKDISDCGSCFDGYFEEIFFGGEIHDLCVPINSNILLPTPEKISSNSYWQDIGIFFLIINIFLIFLIWTYFYKRVRNINSNDMSNSIQDNVENLPPPYESCMKLNNYVTDDVQEFHLFTGEQPPRNEWRHQNAVPFRIPDDSLENINCMDETETLEEVDGASVTREIEGPELHDEETMPSVWSPPPPPQPSISVIMHLENNNDMQTCQPPFKRIRLVQESSDEKSYQDEDNASDKSQDE
ncbi:uncharacterized protein LOC112604190 isoform X1 [Melanaphis sacchari]|uniref:uncharacterized protein LOC112604190 isoform X1 n=2 Tax=Melanaphis sacchari TaxID=742174 RepID=UPI000DC14C8B|nr:uncharacterized protein LOC112604190 isoform X1 [Melanaphis sacchari]